MTFALPVDGLLEKNEISKSDNNAINYHNKTAKWRFPKQTERLEDTKSFSMALKHVCAMMLIS